MEVSSSAQSLAKEILRAYAAHDQQHFEESIESFTKVYSVLFSDLDEASTRRAATHYVEALQIKDLIDEQEDRQLRLTDPRWGQVYEAFQECGQALHLDPRWAYHHHAGFQKHKGELEYWSDLMQAEQYMLDRILRDQNWRNKQSDGRNGPGPLPFLYMVSAECHDLHNPAAAALSLKIMELYFSFVLGSGADPSQP